VEGPVLDLVLLEVEVLRREGARQERGEGAEAGEQRARGARRASPPGAVPYWRRIVRMRSPWTIRGSEDAPFTTLPKTV
jgi:hypothetical protein